MTKDNASDVMHLLHRAGQCADNIYAKALNESHLSPRQAQVLSVIGAEGSLSQTDVVELTGIDRSTTGDIIKRLVRDDYLQRERAMQDARKYDVRLTSRGYKALGVAERAEIESEMELLNAISDRDREKFLKSLAAIVEHFGPIKTARTPLMNRMRPTTR